MELAEFVLNQKEYCTDLRRWFHMHPEPSLKEYNTAKKIEEELDKLKIEHKRVGETGVVASIFGQPSDKVLVIRADTDALVMQDLKENCSYRSLNEGIDHACGHDGHTASLLTTAKILTEMKDQFNGEVRLFFQQSEENGQGARQFVKAGHLENVSRVIGYHGTSDLDIGVVSLTPGPNCAACDYFKITVKGKGAHVSVPHQGVDALYIASQIVVNLQSIVARQTSPLDTVVVGVGVLQAGTSYNIIANEAILEGTTRTFTQEAREKTNLKVTQIAQEIAKLYDAEAEVEFQSFANPLINNETVALELKDQAEKILGIENIRQNTSKRLGADDFADFLQIVPGCYMFVGTRNSHDPNTAMAHHHGLFDIDEQSMLIATNVFVNYALWYLNKI